MNGLEGTKKIVRGEELNSKSMMVPLKKTVSVKEPAIRKQ